MRFSFDPSVILSILVAEFLYLRALRILDGRGVAVPRLQKWFWHIGLSLWVIGLLSPVDTLGDELLSAHMAEHLLIADIAAPFLLAGVRNPVLFFLLPKSALTTLARARRLRSLSRTLRKPMVAVPIYAITLYVWHLSFAFEAAVKHPFIHAMQHATFITTALLVWWCAIEPKRRRMRGELWKIGHILGARLLGMFLGMSFVLMRTPVYTNIYDPKTRGYGLTAMADQQLAGGLMVCVDIILMAFALSYFFWRAAKDAEDQFSPGALPPTEGSNSGEISASRGTGASTNADSAGKVAPADSVPFRQ